MCITQIFRFPQSAIKPKNIPAQLVTCLEQWLSNFGVNAAKLAIQGAEQVRGANGSKAGWRINELTPNSLKVTFQYAEGSGFRWKVLITSSINLQEAFSSYKGSGWETSFSPQQELRAPGPTEESQTPETVLPDLRQRVVFDPAVFWKSFQLEQLTGLLGESWGTADLHEAVGLILSEHEWDHQPAELTDASLSYLQENGLVQPSQAELVAPLPTSAPATPQLDGAFLMSQVTAYADLKQQAEVLSAELKEGEARLRAALEALQSSEHVNGRPSFPEDNVVNNAVNTVLARQREVEQLQAELKKAQASLASSRQAEAQARENLEQRVQRYHREIRQPLEEAVAAHKRSVAELEAKVQATTEALNTPEMQQTAAFAQALKKLA